MNPIGSPSLMRNHDLNRDESGFTMIELLVASGILLVVMFAALGLLQISQRSEPEITSKNARIQTAQLELARMTRELRQTASVVTPSASSLVVDTYVNTADCVDGGAGTAQLCRVTYSCDEGICTRSVGEVSGGGAGPAKEAVHDLASDSIFSYEYSSGTVTGINLTLAVSSDQGSEDAITLNGGVVLRNVSQAPEPL